MNIKEQRNYYIAKQKKVTTREKNEKKNMFQRLHLKIEVTIIYRVYLPAAVAVWKSSKRTIGLCSAKNIKKMKRLKND